MAMLKLMIFKKR